MNPGSRLNRDTSIRMLPPEDSALTNPAYRQAGSPPGQLFTNAK
jgi:hypothetical protein